MLLPEAARFLPDTQTFGEPPVDVTALYIPTPEYVVTSLDQDYRVRPTDGRLVPTVVVSFAVPSLLGTFTIRIDNYAFTHADPLAYMRERSWMLRSMYAIPGDLPPFSDVAEIIPQAGTTLEAAALVAAQRSAS